VVVIVTGSPAGMFRRLFDGARFLAVLFVLSMCDRRRNAPTATSSAGADVGSRACNRLRDRLAAWQVLHLMDIDRRPAGRCRVWQSSCRPGGGAAR